MWMEGRLINYDAKSQVIDMSGLWQCSLCELPSGELPLPVLLSQTAANPYQHFAKSRNSICGICLSSESSTEHTKGVVTHILGVRSLLSAYLIGLYVHLYIYQIQIYWCKANHITDISLHIIRNYYIFYSVKYALYRKIMQMEFMDLNEICILYHVLGTFNYI